MSAYADAIDFLLDPNRVTFHPEVIAKMTPAEVTALVEKLARKAADPRAACSPWFREARRYPR